MYRAISTAPSLSRAQLESYRDVLETTPMAPHIATAFRDAWELVDRWTTTGAWRAELSPAYFAAQGAIFEAIDAQTQGDVRNAAFHLRWCLKELMLGHTLVLEDAYGDPTRID